MFKTAITLALLLLPSLAHADFAPGSYAEARRLESYCHTYVSETAYEDGEWIAVCLDEKLEELGTPFDLAEERCGEMVQRWRSDEIPEWRSMWEACVRLSLDSTITTDDGSFWRNRGPALR